MRNNFNMEKKIDKVLEGTFYTAYDKTGLHSETFDTKQEFDERLRKNGKLRVYGIKSGTPTGYGWRYYKIDHVEEVKRYIIFERTPLYWFK